MGEIATVGRLTYTVADSTWRGQLGDIFKTRSPEHRFLLVTISVTNHARDDISIPLLNLENRAGQTFRELDNGDGVENWIGLFRMISPTQTIQGRLLFDVPLSSYKLRLSDGQAGAETIAHVEIPLRLDSGIDTITPLPAVK